MKGLSVIVPTKDEKSAPSVIAGIYKTLGKDTEVIVVDKSSDEYRAPLQKTGARVLEQTTHGYENALMEGFLAAKGSILATIDADGTYTVDDLKKVVDELAGQEEYAFVSGSRMEKKTSDAMTTSIAFGNGFITWLFNFLYRSSMKDVLSGSFAMKREAFDSMRDEAPYRAGTVFFEIELVRRGYKIKNISIDYSARAGTASQITRSKPFYGFTMAFHAIRYARDYNPLLIFGSIGVLFCLAGLVLGLYVVYVFLHTGMFDLVGRALIAFMLLIVGFLSIIAGLILDLLLELERKIYRKGIK